MDTYTQFHGRLDPRYKIYGISIEGLELLMKFDATQWFINLIPYKDGQYILFDNHFNIYNVYNFYESIYLGYFNEDPSLIAIGSTYYDFKKRPSVYKLSDKYINVVKLITNEYNMKDYTNLILTKLL
jgi:hypothetical protein